MHILSVSDTFWSETSELAPALLCAPKRIFWSEDSVFLACHTAKLLAKYNTEQTLISWPALLYIRFRHQQLETTIVKGKQNHFILTNMILFRDESPFWATKMQANNSKHLSQWHKHFKKASKMIYCMGNEMAEISVITMADQHTTLMRSAANS